MMATSVEQLDAMGVTLDEILEDVRLIAGSPNFNAEEQAAADRLTAKLSALDTAVGEGETAPPPPEPEPPAPERSTRRSGF